MNFKGNCHCGRVVPRDGRHLITLKKPRPLARLAGTLSGITAVRTAAVILSQKEQSRPETRWQQSMSAAPGTSSLCR